MPRCRIVMYNYSESIFPLTVCRFIIAAAALLPAVSRLGNPMQAPWLRATGRVYSFPARMAVMRPLAVLTATSYSCTRPPYSG